MKKEFNRMFKKNDNNSKEENPLYQFLVGK